ncbi:hypothetical protein S144_7 [Shewanella sp. phage 1/44]|uniref:hypothetical protein n=1 Tax=Shewanella sp. phage 1/44 TaxID=1458862 RepID=UPI0004F87C21|nr:hypothetical protein S144_7 [Shewanella sp. phage 1/44]AHK11722.1 hypothetical protein S144_7 [Shewanella sp. phage 1/44]
MKTLITRAQYMANSTELFNEYYLQFATDSSFAFIKSKFPISKLISSKCKHLNDLCKHDRGSAGSWTWDYTPINMTLIKEAGEGNSQSIHTCVGKAIARKMISDYELSITNPIDSFNSCK